eukprot:PhF_6_TR1081/c0_g1_i1/m.2316
MVLLLFAFISFVSGSLMRSMVLERIIGNGTEGFYGDGIIGTSCTLRSVRSFTTLQGTNNNNNNMLYFVDSGNEAVRSYDRVSKLVRTVVGKGTNEVLQDGTRPLTDVLLVQPHSVLLRTSAVMYLTEPVLHRILLVDLQNQIISVAFGVTRTFGYAGDGTSSALLNNPGCLSPSYSGVGEVVGMYICDRGNARIRYYNFTSGKMSTTAGSGEQGTGLENVSPNVAAMYSPEAVVEMPKSSANSFASNNIVYYSDYTADTRSRIRRIANNIVTTLIFSTNALAMVIQGRYLYYASYLTGKIFQVEIANPLKVGVIAGGGTSLERHSTWSLNAKLVNVTGLLVVGRGTMFVGEGTQISRLTSNHTLTIRYKSKTRSKTKILKQSKKSKTITIGKKPTVSPSPTSTPSPGVTSTPSPSPSPTSSSSPSSTPPTTSSSPGTSTTPSTTPHVTLPPPPRLTPTPPILSLLTTVVSGRFTFVPPLYNYPIAEDPPLREAVSVDVSTALNVPQSTVSVALLSSNPKVGMWSITVSMDTLKLITPNLERVLSTPTTAPLTTNAVVARGFSPVSYVLSPLETVPLNLLKPLAYSSIFSNYGTTQTQGYSSDGLSELSLLHQLNVNVTTNSENQTFVYLQNGFTGAITTLYRTCSTRLSRLGILTAAPQVRRETDWRWWLLLLVLVPLWICWAACGVMCYRIGGKVEDGEGRGGGDENGENTEPTAVEDVVGSSSSTMKVRTVPRRSTPVRNPISEVVRWEKY